MAEDKKNKLVPYIVPEDDEGPDQVVSVNLKMYTIMKGEEVMIPDYIAKALNHSKKAKKEARERKKRLKKN